MASRMASRRFPPSFGRAPSTVTSTDTGSPACGGDAASSPRGRCRRRRCRASRDPRRETSVRGPAARPGRAARRRSRGAPRRRPSAPPAAEHPRARCRRGAVPSRARRDASRSRDPMRGEALRPAASVRASSRSAGIGQLEVGRIAGDGRHGNTVAREQLGLIAELLWSRGECLGRREQEVAARALRRLGAEQALAGCCRDDLPCLDTLQGVNDRQYRDGGSVLAGRGGHGLHDARGDEGPRPSWTSTTSASVARTPAATESCRRSPPATTRAPSACSQGRPRARARGRVRPPPRCRARTAQRPSSRAPSAARAGRPGRRAACRCPPSAGWCRRPRRRRRQRASDRCARPYGDGCARLRDQAGSASARRA